MVKIINFLNSGNKLRYAYIVTPQGIATRSAQTATFMGNKLREYDALKVQIKTLHTDLDNSVIAHA